MASARNAQGETFKVSWSIKEWAAMLGMFGSIVFSWATNQAELRHLREVMTMHAPKVEQVPLIAKEVEGHERRITKLEVRP